MRKRLAVAALMVAASCRPAPAPQPTPVAEELFAREYLRVLQDSGAAAVLSRTHPETRRLSNFEANLTTLRNDLASSHAIMTVTEWKVAHPADQPRATAIVFDVRGNGGPSSVTLWIEEHAGRLVVETIMTGSPRP